MKVPTPLIFLLSLTVLFSTGSVNAAVVQVGSSFTVRGSNFPQNFGPTSVPLDGATHSIAGGNLNVRALVTPIDANSEWLEFSFSTPNGPLASNPAARWDFNITNIPYSQPANFGGFFYWWSIDGTAVSNITNWLGGTRFGPNPMDTSLGEVFGGIADPPVPAFDPTLFSSPYSLISTSVVGGDSNLPNEINGFHVLIPVEAANAEVVPEPGSIAIWATISILGLISLRRRKKK